MTGIRVTHPARNRMSVAPKNLEDVFNIFKQIAYAPGILNLIYQTLSILKSLLHPNRPEISTTPPLPHSQNSKMSCLDFSNARRPIEAGVILLGSMEILDVAPIDLLHGISKNVDILPITDELKAKAPEINIHWITEEGEPSKLSSNITIQATVHIGSLFFRSISLTTSN